MKILAIRGANLASLARDFEVDLARGALGGSGLFAIVGNTGAGKSTLLDALCVALFDRTPRISERPRNAVLIGRGVDETTKVSAHDVRAILRRGAGRGFAEVDFQGDDGRRYRARWEVHRARDKAEGALQNQVMSLLALDDAERLGGTKTETLAAIEGRLGLSFDQFRRSALLAQGDFAAFLRADGKDRSELLERMTGTEIYSQLSMAAHQRGQLAEQRIKELGLSMTAIEVLADEALAQLGAELAAAGDEHDQHKRQLAEAERAAQWWQQRGRLALELGEAEREQDSALAAEQAAGPLRQERELRRRGETLRPAWQAAQQATRVAGERAQLVTATEAIVEQARAAAEQARQARAHSAGRSRRGGSWRRSRSTSRR
jgi:DNA repair protein SbcC/Rad50